MFSINTEGYCLMLPMVYIMFPPTLNPFNIYLLRPQTTTSVHSQCIVRYVRVFYFHDEKVSHEFGQYALIYYTTTFFAVAVVNKVPNKNLTSLYNLITKNRLVQCYRYLNRQCLIQLNIEDNSPKLCVIQRRHSKQDTQIT